MRPPRIVKYAAIAAVTGLALAFFCVSVPFDMDEFIPYDLLSTYCYPLNALNIYADNTWQFDLDLFGRFLPLRAFPYVGAISSVVYYPLFLAWPSPWSARLLGLIYLFLQAMCLHRIFKLSTFWSFIFLLIFMPYAFQHVVDTGPVIAQTTSVFLACYLAQRWKTAFRDGRANAWKYPLLIGIVLFLAIFFKLAYFFILPSVLILVLAVLFSEPAARSSLSRACRQLLVMAAAAGIPSFLMLSLKDRRGNTFFSVIDSGRTVPFSDAPGLWHHFNELSVYLKNPLLSAQRVFEIDPEKWTLEGMLLGGVVTALLVFGVWQSARRKTDRSFLIAVILGFCLALLLMSKSLNTWAMHHVVLAFPFLILALCHIYSVFPRHVFVRALAVVFLAVNIGLYCQFARLTPVKSDHPSKVRLVELLNRRYARDYVFVVIDWGMYYLKALYGPREQCILSMTPLRSQGDIENLREVMRKTKRKVLFIGMRSSVSNVGLLRAQFPDLVQLSAGFDTGDWVVLYQP